MSFRRGRALALSGIVVILVASRVSTPWIALGPVVCPLRTLTGFPCPGCGLTRAFVALAHGHVSAALALNAMSVPLLAGILVALPLLLVELSRGRPLMSYRFLYSQRLAMGLAFLLAGYNVARTLWWAFDGTLVADYLSHSWWYWLARQAGWHA
jgi:Protein of unknown function (DUF2752)